MIFQKKIVHIIIKTLLIIDKEYYKKTYKSYKYKYKYKINN